MRKYSLILACALSVLFLLISGCAKKPVEEIKRAENAISNVRQAGADKWAASSLRAAEAKFKEAMGLVDSKKYKEALPALEATVTDTRVQVDVGVKVVTLPSSRIDCAICVVPSDFTHTEKV